MKRILSGAFPALVLLAASAAPAWACLPPLPRTSEQMAALDLERQVSALERAPFIYEVEVIEVFTRVPIMDPYGPPSIYSSRLHLRFQPVRTVRGEGEGAAFEMNYPNGCGGGIDGPAEVGARYLAWALRPPEQQSDVIELMPVVRITHPQTMEMLGLD